VAGKEVAGLTELEGDDAAGVGDVQAADGVGFEGGLDGRVGHRVCFYQKTASKCQPQTRYREEVARKR
jgi:hypothetical protein